MTDVPFFDTLPIIFHYQFWKQRFDLNLNFGPSYIHGGSVVSTPAWNLSPLPTTPDVHPVNYFVSGYLQRAVNSCRADYTDRFIALVSQSNVRNAPPPATTLARCFSGLPEFPDSPSFLLASFRSDFDRLCSKRATIFFFSARKTYATSLISIKNKYNTNVIWII